MNLFHTNQLFKKVIEDYLKDKGIKSEWVRVDSSDGPIPGTFEFDVIATYKQESNIRQVRAKVTLSGKVESFREL